MLFDRLIRPPECGGVLGGKLLAWSTFGVQGRTILQQGRSRLALGPALVPNARICVAHYGTRAVAWFEFVLSVPLEFTDVTT